MRTGTRALLAGDPIPISVFVLTVLFSFLCTWLMSKLIFQSRKKAAEELRETIRLLRERRAISDNWSNEWRARELAAMQPPLSTESECVTEWLRSWHAQYALRFRGKAFRACLLLGESDYYELLELFQQANMENIRRWSLVTGKPIPRWS
jgi:hypothetical protein